MKWQRFWKKAVESMLENNKGPPAGLMEGSLRIVDEREDSDKKRVKLFRGATQKSFSGSVIKPQRASAPTLYTAC